LKHADMKQCISYQTIHRLHSTLTTIKTLALFDIEMPDGWLKEACTPLTIALAAPWTARKSSHPGCADINAPDDLIASVALHLF